MIRPVALLLALSLTAPAAAQTDPERIAAAEAELAALQERIRAMNEALTRERNEKDGLQAALEQAERDIAEVQAQLAQLDERLRAQQAELRRAEGRREQAAQQLERQRARLAEQLKAAHRMGESPVMRLLLHQEDALALSRMMAYFDYLNRARAIRIREVQAQLQVLLDFETSVREEEARLAALRDERRGLLARLETGRAEREAALRRVEARIRDAGEALAALRRDEQAVEKLLESLGNILADIPLNLGDARPFAQSRGRLVPPVQGRLLARFGEPKKGTSLSWKGQWIAARTGTPVRAAAAGRVAHVGWLHRYGLLVILEHDGDYYTLYGHNEAVDVTLGQWVQAGERIARAGTSGGHRESGVYFEIRKGRTAIDPRPWLSK